MKNILYYLQPQIEQKDTYFRYSTLKSIILPEVLKILEYKSDTNIKIVVSKEIYERIIQENENLNQKLFVTIDSKSLDSILSDSLSASINIQNEEYSEEQLKKFNLLLIEQLKGYNPDLVISYESPNFLLKKVFYDAVHLNYMFGAFSRAPFPSFGYYDPCGIYAKSYLNKFKSQILSTKISTDEKNVIRTLRRNAMHALSENISIKEKIFSIKSEFKKVILLAHQVDDHIAFNSCTEYFNHFELTKDVLDNTPEDIGVIITSHSHSTQITEKDKEYLENNYSNVIFWNNDTNIPSISQFILPYIDGLITVSSSLAYQSALWKKPFFALGKSQVDIFSIANSFEDFYLHINSEQSIDFDNVLYFILSKINLFYKHEILNGEYLYNYFRNIYNKLSGNKTVKFDFYDDFAKAPSELINKINEADRKWLLKKEVAESGNKVLTDVLANAISKHNAISFDLFDTLAERDFLVPHELFLFIENDVRKYLKNKNFNFHYFRTEAEKDVRRPTRGEYEITIDQIYERFIELTGISYQEAEYIKELELSAEYQLIHPKKNIVLYYDLAKLLCDTVTIITDIYLDKDFIEKVLNKIGLDDYDYLLVSADTKTRKHNGSIYPEYLKHIKDNYNIEADKCLHIGDNSIADGEMAKMYGMSIYVKPKAIDNYKRSLIGKVMERSIHSSSISTSILNGFIANKFYATSYNKVNSTSLFEASAYQFGFQAFGPLVLGFIQSLNRQIVKNDVSDVFFLARDGWILKKAYDSYFADSEKATKSHYLYSSRRCAMVASIRNFDDIREITSQSFNARSIESFLNSRFGIEWTEEISMIAKKHHYKSNSIVSPYIEQKKLVLFLKDISEFIIENSKKERESYLDYLEEIGFVEAVSNRKPILVDIGYSGSMQYYLKKILEIDQLDGYYFLTHHHARDQFVKDYFEGYLSSLDDHRSVYHHKLNDHVFIFESALSSPEGSLIKFTGSGSSRKMVLLDAEEEINRIKIMNHLHKGIYDFTIDIVSRFGFLKGNFEFAPKVVSRIILNFADHPNQIDPKIFENLEVENVFGGGTVYLIAKYDSKAKNNKLLYENLLKSSKWKKGAEAYYRGLNVLNNTIAVNENLNKENNIVEKDIKNKKKAKLLKNPYLFFKDSKKCCLSKISYLFNTKHILGRILTNIIRRIFS